MKMDKPIEVDLLEFFRSGKFDYLKLGQTKTWILNNFPDPDSGFDAEMQSHGFDIWTYGNLELHFENEKLFLIFTDNFDGFTGGKALSIKPWILDNWDNLNVLYVLKMLNEQNIDYKKKTDQFGVLIRLNSGVELTFENLKEIEGLSPNEFMLTSFALVAENPNRWRVNEA